MDANGLRFWMLADREQWDLTAGAAAGEAPAVTYDPDRRSLRLVSRRPLSPVLTGPPSTLRGNALARLARVPQTSDAFGTQAYWDPEAGAVMATGALPNAVPIFTPPVPPTDLAMGHDGILYAAIDGGVTLIDRRGRWSPVNIRAAGFSAWRLGADPAGGVWVLDRTDRRLGRLTGEPLPERARGAADAATFRPAIEDPDPPTLRVIDTAVWEIDETPVALACSPNGRLAALSWFEGGPARVRVLGENQRWQTPAILRRVLYPFSLIWLSNHSVAVLLADLADEAPVYHLPGGGPLMLEPTGDYYPLRDHDGGPFLNGVTWPARYATRPAGTSRPLYHLSLPVFVREGEAAGGRPLDSGRLGTVWHRLYLEASLPPECGLIVFLAAGDTPEPPAWDGPGWHEHRFGRLFTAENSPSRRIPRGAWVSYPSEIPHHPGLLTCARVPHRAGLFTSLISRATSDDSALRGRYLHVRVRLIGSGRAGPELWALRAYGGRFSYVENYLPDLYRRPLYDAAGEQERRAADFLERFVNNFEGLLTPLEDRVAAGYLLTDPRTAPAEALAWLGRWVGLNLEEMADPFVRRRLIANAARLYRRRGTPAGLHLALDLATNDAVSLGAIVIVEQWRLRRTFATILGADLAQEDDPLLPGLAVSGNAFVGDTLFLGDETRREFMALFDADLDLTAGEEAAVQAFFEALAYRVTVLVHDEIAPQDFDLIRRIVAAEIPAHIEASVVPARYPFLVGVAGLLGIDTYLVPDRPPTPVRVNQSDIGVRDQILRSPSLDPRLEGGQRI